MTAKKKKTDIKELQSEIDELKKNIEETNDKFVRVLAEFDNFKKFNEKEMAEFKQFASKDVMIDLLPVIDDFERALEKVPTNEDNPAYEGLKLIHKKLKETLENKGLREMNAIGEEFNADLHEAITKSKAPNKKMKDKILNEIEKGYYLNDRIIRYAKVIVGE